MTALHAPAFREDATSHGKGPPEKPALVVSVVALPSNERVDILISAEMAYLPNRPLGLMMPTKVPNGPA